MKYVITKEFRFEAAHRLVKNYTGKCTNNHGHSFNVKLYLEADKLDERDMLVDFQEIKALKKWVDDNYDHTTILWEGDPMIEMIKEYGNKVMITPKSPTSEHIAELLLKKAQEIFEDSRVKVHCIEINETCTTGARIYT